MPIDWPTATIEAIRSVCRKSGSSKFTREELIAGELRNIISATGSAGQTPAQTLSRILQNLRDAGKIQFLGRGNYRLLSATAGRVEAISAPRTEDTEIKKPSSPSSTIVQAPLTACDLGEPEPAERSLMTVSRIIRDSRIVQQLKSVYEYRCQICSNTIELRTGQGRYCEAHHIRPLGRPHEGSDNIANLVIVCPNHHAMLDFGAIPSASNELQITRHRIDQANIDYHNSNIYGRG